MLDEILLKNLRAEGLFADGSPAHLLLAYSGGIDSSVLLHVLVQLRERLPLKITAAYYDHGWRGTPPDELRLVHRNCQIYKVPLVAIQPDRTLAKTETVAREVRYRELARLACDLRADGILTAHQAEDQVETLLFRLFRGTGVDGLAGIPKRRLLITEDGREVPVYRPMLDIYREGIRRYAEEKELRYFEDPTNRNTKIHRNALRHEIIPAIQQRFPQVKRSLLRLAEIVTGDVEILDEKLQEVWDTVALPDDGLDTSAFNQLKQPYQRRVVKRFLQEHQVEVDHDTIDDVVGFVQGTNRKNLHRGLMSLESAATGEKRFLSLYRNRLGLVRGDAPVVSRQTPEIPVSFTEETPLPALKAWLQVAELSAEEATRLVKTGLPEVKGQQSIVGDFADVLDKPVVVRTRRAGDIFQPLGMTEPIRLKRYFINRGIERFQRDNIPLLACGDEILWVVGWEISEVLRVYDKPTHRLTLATAPQAPDSLPQTVGST